MRTDQLYRTTALNASRTKWLGDIVLARPVSFGFLTAFATILAALVIIFLTCETYTKHSTVAGQLMPASGLVKIYTPQAGVVVEQHVIEGHAVKQGDTLIVLSSERQSLRGPTQATISERVNTRQRSLRDHLDKTRRLQRDEILSLQTKIAAQQQEAAKLDTEIESQHVRVKLAEEAFARYQDLVAKNFVSKETLQQKQAELLDQRLRLQSLERDQIVVRRDAGTAQDELASLPLRHANQLAEIERDVAVVDQELSESEAKRRLVVTAPENGIATAVVVNTGQAVDPSKPLLSIVPSNAKLHAHLYAPSRAVGFARPGDTVLLRYQAYPYQKFGHARGKVMSVAKSALPGAEINELGNSTNTLNGNGSEPLYLITVDLESQTIQAYGKPQTLQAGMLLEADILQDTRRLYEWVLEPLYSLTGKL